MISIVRANESHTQLLSKLFKQTFLESHGHSANAEDINVYVAEKCNETIVKKELTDSENIYHILYYNNKAVGFSKIILNSPYTYCSPGNVAKLERIYVLKEVYDLHLGKTLFDFNVALLKENKQVGVWLYVWIENQRALNFYKKKGFVIIGSHDFKISENHSNPNHQMLLSFE